MWKILLEEFWADLRTQKTRAALTILAVAWGTLSIILLLAFGEGLYRMVVEGTLGAGEKMFMVYNGETGKVYEGLPRGRSIRLRVDDMDLILRSIPEVDLVSASYGRWGTVVESEALRTTTMMEGVHPAFAVMRNTYPVKGGRFLNVKDVEQRRRVVFIGDSLAHRLFPEGNAVGKWVEIDGVRFRVVGVMQSKIQSSMDNGPDSERLLIPATTFEAIYGARYVSHLLVRPRNVAEAELVKRKLFEVLGRRHKFDPTDDRALRMWDFVEDEKMSRRIGRGIQIFLGMVGGLTLLVAGVGVANIMYVVVKERTREIGVKLAIGARKRHVLAQFVFESLALALTGGAIGATLAILLVIGVDSLPANNMALQFLANPKLSWPIALTTVGILAGIGVVAGVFPARRAASVDPVESLRYE